MGIKAETAAVMRAAAVRAVGDWGLGIRDQGLGTRKVRKAVVKANSIFLISNPLFNQSCLLKRDRGKRSL
jgi:hypothetical protein